MPDKILDLVAALVPGSSASVRIATVSALSGNYALTDITGSAKIVMNSDVQVSTGDRVLLLKQDSTFTLIARLSGSQSTGFAPVGSVMSYAGTNAPSGWLLCQGQAVSRSTYAVLFAAVGTTYGDGDGSTTFNLPNLQNRFPLGTGSRSAGATGGAETVTLSAGQLPSHSHSIPRGAGTQAVASGTGATVPNNTAGTTGSVGSGSSHENMPPFLVLPFIIRVS